MFRKAIDTVYYTSELDSDFARFIAFIGLPRFRRKTGVNDENYPQTIKQLFFNFIGYKPKSSVIINILRILTFPIIHLIEWPFKLAINILKIFTEFLPELMHRALLKFYGFATKKSKSENKHVHRFFIVAKWLAILGNYFLRLVKWVGAAITSPYQNLLFSWKEGHRIGGSKVLGSILGCIFIFFSMAISATVYALIFPIALKLMIVPIVSALPSVITNLINVALLSLPQLPNALMMNGVGGVIGLLPILYSAAKDIAVNQFKIKPLGKETNVVEELYEREDEAIADDNEKSTTTSIREDDRHAFSRGSSLGTNFFHEKIQSEEPNKKTGTEPSPTD